MVGFLELLDEAEVSLPRVSLPAGELLFEQGEIGKSMYIVLEGGLKAIIKNDDNQPIPVGEIHPGQPVGEMQVFTGGKRTASVAAMVDSTLVEIPSDKIDSLKVDHPNLYQELEHLVFQRMRRNHLRLLLPDLFGAMDEDELQSLEADLEWRHLSKGERLIHQGDVGDAMYIVLSGRLNVVIKDDQGEDKVVLEIGRGETVGEMALFNNDPRTANVDAARDSMLICIQKSTFFATAARFPRLHEHVTRVMIRRLQMAARPSRQDVDVLNVVVLPLHRSLPLSSILDKLEEALSAYGSTLRVSRERLSQLADFRPQVKWFEDQSDNLRLSIWLDKIERHHRFVLFEADLEPTTWNHRLIQYADRVLLVGDASASAARTSLETECLKKTPESQQVLCLVHSDDARLPTGTKAWLSTRNVGRHFHLRQRKTEDIARLARYLADRSIGLVLGGGGARGFAHIGIIKAFRNIGIPIDMVGGSSMGAVIAAHAAMEFTYDETLERNRRAFVDERPFRKELLPLISFYKGKKLNEVTHEILYQDHCFEDLWLPAFATSCSLGTSELVVHEQGKIWEAIRASTALPGIVAPVSDGKLLHVDGGLMNNLPVDLMRERCKGPIVAVEVSDMTDLEATGLEAPSLFEYVKHRWLPGQSKHPFPSVLEILMRSLLLGSIQNVKRARQQADLLLSPPIEQFGLLEFEVIQEVAEIGYNYAMKELTEWKRTLE